MTVRETEKLLEAVGVVVRILKARWPNTSAEDAYDMAAKITRAVQQTMAKEG